MTTINIHNYRTSDRRRKTADDWSPEAREAAAKARAQKLKSYPGKQHSGLGIPHKGHPLHERSDSRLNDVVSHPHRTGGDVHEKAALENQKDKARSILNWRKENGVSR